MTIKYSILVLIALSIVGLAIFYIMRGEDVVSEDHDDDAVAAYEIYPGDVVKKIQNGEDIVLLDVRTPEEYESVHLEGALLLPVQELSQQSLAAIGLGESAKDQEIIIYCRSGARSKTAYDILVSLGYTNTKSVAGGMIHWEEDEYPFTQVGAYMRAVGQTVGVAAGDGPKIVLNRDTHDFGKIQQYGGVVETTFIVKNEGTKSLSVGTITTSCSCTSAEISNTNIAVGESAVLTVRFDPDFHDEPRDIFKRTVFIPTNDPLNSEAEVTITVDIAEGE